MALASDIITDAYRELNLIPQGTLPNTAQNTEGLTRLNVFMRIIFGYRLGELLRDWEVPFQQRTAPVAANFPQNPYPLNQDALAFGLPLSGGSSTQIYPYPPKNSRIVFGGTSAMTAYFPEQPDDGSRMGLVQGALAGTGVTLTLDGNSRLISGAPTVSFTTPFAFQYWIYRADNAAWYPIVDLALTDTMPFPDDMNEFFILSLARRLAPPNDKTMSPESMMMLKEATAIFAARYHQEGTSTFGSENIPLGYESFLSGRYWF